MALQVPGKRRKRMWLGAVLLLVIAGLASCVVGIRSFFDEDRNPVQRFAVFKTLPPTRLEVNATVISTDPVRGSMKLELDFHPQGDIVEANGHDMARDVHLLTNNAQGQSEFVLKRHHQPHPIEMTLSLLDGDVALYPIDQYNALLQLEAYIEPGGDEEVAVPLVVNFVSHNHMLHAEASLGPDSEAHEVNIQIKLKRPPAVQAFAWFMNGLMAMIALSAALVTFNVAYRDKKLEPNLMVWTSALLFVLPTIRNMLPGVPPLGSFTDFLVFFWVEAVISLCLFILVLVWYRRAPDR